MATLAKKHGMSRWRDAAPMSRGTLPRYLVAAVLARLADDGARVALILLANARTSSVAFGGALVAALLFPHVVAAPVVGALADRVRNRRPFHAAALAVFGGALALFAVLVGRAPSWLVLTVAVAGGCVGPLITGGLTALLKDLVPSARLSRAYGMDAASYNAAGISGPALAALLASVVNPGVAIYALAACAGSAAIILGTLPLAPRVSLQTERPPLTRGIAALWRDRTLRAVTVASSIGHVGVGALPLVAVLLAAGYHAPAASGMLISSSAVGGLLGSLGYARRPIGTDAPEWVVPGCLLATAIALALASLTTNIPFAAVLFGFAGVFSGPSNSSLFLVREQRSPSDARAQVFTLGGGLKYSAAALGAAVAGIGAGIGGVVLLLTVAGCEALAAGIGAALLRSARSSTDRGA